ncbi:MAG: DUF3037 domain-containing protein [Candidatus Acidiferrales bacterium]
MPEEAKNTYRYRVLRYTPDLVRDEWVNIGVLLEDAGEDAVAGPRRSLRVIEDAAEIARVRRLHPTADEELLRQLPLEFEMRLSASAPDARVYLDKLGDTLSNVLQFSPQRAVLAEDFDAELDRLYRDHVAPPARARGGMVESTRAWIRARLNDVFHRHRVLSKLERSVRVDPFTQPGDPLRLDYAYQNGVRGYMHSVALNRDAAQSKVLAYTAECVRARLPQSEFTAITEAEPSPGNPRHQFVARLFAEQNIRIVPLNRVEMFAEELRLKLH